MSTPVSIPPQALRRIAFAYFSGVKVRSPVFTEEDIVLLIKYNYQELRDSFTREHLRQLRSWLDSPARPDSIKQICRDRLNALSPKQRLDYMLTLLEEISMAATANGDMRRAEKAKRDGEAVKQSIRELEPEETREPEELEWGDRRGTGRAYPGDMRKERSQQ
ncbi:hypothetical protein MMC28_004472 [Mycoblastus sanguinarius]|nr:hypothetical protein [Mycoblastus sanguinarius]